MLKVAVLAVPQLVPPRALLRRHLKASGCPKLTLSPRLTVQVDVPNLVAAELGVGEADVCKEGTSTPCTAYLDAYNAARTGGGVHDRLKQGKNIGWTMVSLHAADQLRQRVAWSLYQIFVVSDMGIDNPLALSNEVWQSYHDIFVRHAFGSYRDVMREVSYAPIMMAYLTYDNNRAMAYDGSYPDENYAREIMQLFSIGLWELDGDGTYRLDARGQPMMTYTNDDILDLSRAWTGFTKRPDRGNVENYKGGDSGGTNYIDPARLRPDYRDVFPKLDLHGGYVGDGYPLCADLAPDLFLRAGTSYTYLGPALTTDMTRSFLAEGMPLADASSPLYRALCAPSGDGGKCALRSSVTLAADLACHGIECDTDHGPRLVRIANGNATAYFEWERPPCVELAFFNDGQLIVRSNSQDADMCADPSVAMAGSCCVTRASGELAQCRYKSELMSYATSESRCHSDGWSPGGGEVCALIRPVNNWRYDIDPQDGKDPLECGYHGRGSDTVVRMWSRQPCAMQIEVDRNGWVNHYDGAYVSKFSNRPSFGKGNGNLFRVAWEGAVDSVSGRPTWHYPTVADGSCGNGACAVDGESCLCNVTVETTMALQNYPEGSGGAAEVVAACQIGSLCPFDEEELAAARARGAPPPLRHAPGKYELLRVGAEVDTYFLTPPDGGRSYAGGWNEDALFHVKATGRCFLNRLSTVHVGDFGGLGGGGKQRAAGAGAPSPYAFRNAPHFMNYVWATASDAAHEIEALLDHLFEHANTAPFVAHHFVQRFTTSNPSPRYVRAVADAFRTGSHDGVTYGGEYGDLGATIAAILLDREARRCSCPSLSPPRTCFYPTS